MNDPNLPTFLARESYRNRRIADAARVLPLAGLIFFMLPLLWTGPNTADGSTGSAGLYLFAVWFILIVVAFAMAPRLRRLNEQEAEEQQQGTDGSL